MVTVCDVERGDRIERHYELMLFGRFDDPNRVLHTVNGGEVVERFPGRDSLDQSIDRRPRSIRKEHRPRLRPQVEQMPGAVVFLVATRMLVFANDIAVVIVDGKATRQTDLGMTTHAQPTGG